jgi:hypothetical protein
MFINTWKSPAVPARAHCPRQAMASAWAARLCLLNNGSDWLPPGEAPVRMSLRAMCPAVSGSDE